MNFILFLAVAMGFLFSSCLKTRADLGERDQSQVYSRKSIDNQQSEKSSRPSQLSGKAQSQVQASADERDELIRSFNGRIENLENQISTLQKEKAAAAGNNAEAQKIQLLQDALTKMEAQIQKLEAEGAPPVATKTTPSAGGTTVTGSDLNTVKNSAAGPTAKTSETAKKSPTSSSTTMGAYEIAQEHFGRKEWKKSILSYQKYVDESAKGKNVPDAKYKIGVCFQELGMKEEAMAFYEEVIANYGKTESGKKARIRLSKIKK